MNWRDRVFTNPKHDGLDHELSKNIIPAARRINDIWIRTCQRPLYHELYMDWLDTAVRSNNKHIKQLAISWFLLTDADYRGYACSTFGCGTKWFNTFMEKLEVLTHRLTCGLKMSDGTKYEIVPPASGGGGGGIVISGDEPDWTHHCGHFAIELIKIANKI